MRIAELKIAKASSPRPKIVKPNKGGSSKHPMRGKLVGEQKIEEVFPALLAPAVWSAARVAAPWLIKQGWRLVKGTTKVAVKNPKTAIAVGTGVAYKDELAAVAEFLKGIGETVEPVIKYVKQYGLPILAVVALLYGGKKIVDMVKNEDPETVNEGEQRTDITKLMILHIREYLESKGPGSFISMEDLESDLYDFAREITHDDLKSPQHLRDFMSNPGDEASSAVGELISGMYPPEFEDYITTESVNNNLFHISVNGRIVMPNVTKDKINSYKTILKQKYPDGKVDSQPVTKKTQEGNKPQKPKPYNTKRNPVAKNIEKFNRPVTHQDKKKELKKKGPSIDLDEAPFVVSGGESIKIAVNKTEDWLRDKFSDGKSYHTNIDALQELGNLVGYTVEPRGSKSVTFNKFFTQTDEHS